jgi:hypothetical protein
MLIKNLTKREKYIAAATVIVAAAAILYVFILEPISSRWSDLDKGIVSKQAELEKDTRILSKKKSLEADYAGISKFLKGAKSEDEAVADAMAYIENTSRSDSCLIVSIKPVGVKKTGSYKEILIDVSAEATMAQFSKFLYDIENPEEMILTVKRFVITPKSGQQKVLKGSFLISRLSVD